MSNRNSRMIQRTAREACDVSGPAWNSINDGGTTRFPKLGASFQRLTRMVMHLLLQLGQLAGCVTIQHRVTAALPWPGLFHIVIEQWSQTLLLIGRSCLLTPACCHKERLWQRHSCVLLINVVFGNSLYRYNAFSLFPQHTCSLYYFPPSPSSSSLSSSLTSFPHSWHFVLFCVLHGINRAICVMMGLEISIRGEWVYQLAYDWVLCLNHPSNLLPANSSPVSSRALWLLVLDNSLPEFRINQSRIRQLSWLL